MNGVRRIIEVVKNRWRSAKWKYAGRLYYMRASANARRYIPADTVDVPRERHGDGNAAYWVCPEGLSERSVVYSFGVGADISFDTSLIEKYGLDVFAFDPTDESANWVRRQRPPESFRFRQIGISSVDGEMALRTIKPASATYRPATFLEIDERETPPASVPVRSLRSIMSELNHDVVDILKLDIEGGEYDVIDAWAGDRIPANQIVLEFHPHLINLARHGHFFGKAGWLRTRAAIDALVDNGYRIFHLSDRGTELSLIKR